MSEFAQLDGEGIVLQVIVADQGFISSGLVGNPSAWVPVIPEGSAGIGFAFDPVFGDFVSPDGLSAQQAKDRLLAVIAEIEAVALSGYSEGERQSWATQMREAASFLGITQAQLLAGEPGTPGTDLALAPFLVGSCEAEYGPATNEDRLAQVNQLAPAVAANAKALSDLSQALVGVRRSAFLAIDAAGDGAGREAALEAATLALSAIG